MLLRKVILLGNYGKKMRVNALADGARALGFEILHLPDPNGTAIARIDPETTAFAITFGHRSQEAFAKGWLLNSRIPTIVTELGYLKRSRGVSDTEGYNQLGINRLNWMPNDPCPEDRFNALCVPIKPFCGEGRNLLFLGQVPADTQHGMSLEEQRSYTLGTVGWLMSQGYKICYRPHPAAPNSLVTYVRKRFFHEFSDPRKVSFEEDLAKCDCVATYNSTAGFQALLEGKRVFCSRRAFYYQASVGLMSREELAYRVAYAQWNCAELSSGEALKFILKHHARTRNIFAESKSDSSIIVNEPTKVQAGQPDEDQVVNHELSNGEVVSR